jgi:hypothetical protein
MRPVRRAENLITFMCRLSLNLEASTAWNHQALSRPVMGLLYVHLSFTNSHFLISVHKQSECTLFLAAPHRITRSLLGTISE